MQQKIRESDRVFSILLNDSRQDPERILKSFESEIEDVAKDYLNLNGKVKLRYKITGQGLVFFAEIPASSVRSLFYIQ